MYKQCKLVKKNSETSTTEQISYIPAQFAKLNKILKLDVNGEWIDGWKVVEVYGEAKAAKDVENLAHNSKDIWKAGCGSNPRGNK